MLDSIAENTGCEPTSSTRAALATCGEIVDRKLPNLFRLYLNPYVAQACYCAGEAIKSAWPAAGGPQQVFLANSFEEALSGAIKLARYDRAERRRSAQGLIIDETDRLKYFADAELADGGRLEFIPALRVVNDVGRAVAALDDATRRPGFVVASAAVMQAPDGEFARRWSTLPADGKPLLIVHVDRERLFLDDPTVDDAWRQVVPDVIVLDESFVDRGVPFGAFAAGPQLFGRWNRRGMATFHSTTYQPNTISTLHFMNCLRRARPDFVARHADQLERLEHDPEFLLAEFRRRYSPSLGKLIKAAGFDRGPIRAVGHYIEHGERKLFDAVAGVACSVRGHNPESYAAELESMDGLDRCRHEIARRLRTLTGLSHFSPAVSGASAVEQALKLGLLAQFPRSHVLALQGGFGGKTLFALTGTAKPSLKRGLDPLYPHVVYVDPFSPRAGEQIEDVCRHLPVGVVQFELVQGVGGVRAVPPNVLQCLVRMRERHGCLLFVDEVQTGVYRTGPFARSAELGLRPDLLTVGKGTSDMMFPFALTLYSAEVRRRLEARDCGLPQLLDERYGYELGYRTVLNTLRRADEHDLEARVRRAGERLAEALAAALRSCRAVRDVRCFGLLVGVELDVSGFPRRLFRRLIPRLSLLAMMQHREFPLVAGFCQYEPNVLKLTPPLSIDDDEIQSVAATLAAVLRMSPMRLASSALLNRRRPTSC